VVLSHSIRVLCIEKVVLMNRIVRMVALTTLISTTALAGVASGASARSRSDEGHSNKGHRHGHGHPGQYFCPASVSLSPSKVSVGDTVTITPDGFKSSSITVYNEKHVAQTLTGTSFVAQAAGEYEVRATGESSCHAGRTVKAEAELKVRKKK